MLGFSTLFILTVSIFALIGGLMVNLNNEIGCNSKYNGIFEAWRSVDAYLIEVDSILCSSNCPCYFDRNSSMSYIRSYPGVAYYSSWWKTSNFDKGAINFDNCTDIYKNEAYNNYMYKLPNSTFINQLSFSDYFNNIERYFDCTGFCLTGYYNDQLGSSMQMYKYLFSDINR